MRKELKQATREAHDKLDLLAGHLPVTTRASYAAFLQAQRAARLAAENAFRLTPPESLSRPPVQAESIRADLQELGAQTAVPMHSISFANPCEALGAAWVVAGSSLGNKAMLVQRHKAGLSGAERFLSDPRMPEYFALLLTRLDQPRSEISRSSVLCGARECFDLFESAFSSLPESLAA